jgi:NADPH-ferrihemoprotein reductase
VQPSSRFYFSSHNALLLTKEELRNTEEDEGSTLHMEFDVSGLHGHGESFYTTADNLAILPENDGDVVETLATFLGYELSDYFTIAASSSSTTTAVKHPFPTPTTVDAFLRKYCDLVSVPRRSTANAILPFIGDSQERARATAMIKNKDIWKEEVEDQKLSYYEILMLFPSIDIPLAHFISIVPKLQPRYYTISSSNLVHPDRVHVTVALVGQEIERPEGSFHKSKLFKGVCTHYLSSLQPEIDSVQLFVRESTFEMPASFETPIILLGPGTGYAPMRALLQERQFLMEQNPSASFGEAVLFFGCKTRTSDFIYQDEIEALTNDEVLSHLLLAFSREQGHKVYVQHMMTSCPEVVHLLADLVLNKGAHIYVCGGTRMGQDILQTFALLLGYFLENNQIEASDEQSEEFQTLVAEDKDFDAFNTSSCAIYDGRYMDAYKASEEEGNFLQRAAPFKERGLALIHEMEGNGRYVQELWS